MVPSSQRFRSIVDDVRRDIDKFLEPGVPKLADIGRPSSQSASVVHEASPFGATAAGSAELQLQLLELRGQGDSLRAKLNNAKCDAEALRAESERCASRDAAAFAKLTHECDQLVMEHRAKKRRLNQVEDELLLLQKERDAVTRESEEVKERSKQNFDRLRRETEVERQRSEAISAELSAARVAASVPPEASARAEVEGLRERVMEAERENHSLRLAFEQVRPEVELGAQLRQRHAECEDELRCARELRSEVQDLRVRTLKLEQEDAALRAALEVRDSALCKAEDSLRSLSLAKRDLDAFCTTTAAIIAESEAAGTVPTPFDLSLAWTRLQSETTRLRREQVEAAERERDAAENERKAQSELSRLRASLATTQAHADEQDCELVHLRDENASLLARTAVLREAVAKRCSIGGEVPPLAVQDDALGTSQSQLDTAERRAAHFEGVAQARGRALGKVSEELESLRQEHARLADAEARAMGLKQINASLWTSNQELEGRLERLASEVASGEELRSECAALREKIGQLRSMSKVVSVPFPAGDLEQQQAARELRCYKQCAKKYVQDFREGTFNLLGWKVELLSNGSGEMQWHLTSCYHKAQKLIFQLRPMEAGRTPEFDLLSTPWGEQLQADRQAMTYLEVYGSIPGFLGHITADLLTRRTLPS